VHPLHSVSGKLVQTTSTSSQASDYLFLIASMSDYDMADVEPQRNLKTEHPGDSVTRHPTSNESRSIEGHRESNLASPSQPWNRKRCGFGTGLDGSRNNGNIGHFPPFNPDSRMEAEEETGNSSLRQVYENDSIRHSTYPHSSRKDSLSQPYSYNGATIPHPQQYYPTPMQQPGQSGSYTDSQPEIGHATRCNNGHNNNTVNQQTDRYFYSENVYPDEPFRELVLREMMNQARTTDTNGYENSTSYSPRSQYLSLNPQADIGQLSQHGRDIVSFEWQWPPQDPQRDLPYPTMELTTVEDQPGFEDSDAYSGGIGSQVFSERDRSTTDSSLNLSVNGMNSSAATIRPSLQIISDRETFQSDTFGSHPLRDRAASIESLRSGYNRIPQDIKPQNRSYNLGLGFGIRPT
jgi:hypothetical protein